MAKMVGLAKPLKLVWLEKTVELVLEDMPAERIKSELNDYLSFEISSPTTHRKTRESLINLWVAPVEGFAGIRELALSLYPAVSSDKLPFHWCMLLARYPIFADMCTLIGKSALVEETFTPAWIKEKLYDSWGERHTTLDYPIQNILQTLHGFEALKRVRTGVYEITVRQINDDRTIQMMILTLLALKKKAYYEIAELSRAPMFFPFTYDVSLEWLHNAPEICVSTFGGKTVVSMRD
jgi:hypothetical protein